jgi:CxxC motif-containing protein (DUF1111 family)
VATRPGNPAATENGGQPPKGGGPGPGNPAAPVLADRRALEPATATDARAEGARTTPVGIIRARKDGKAEIVEARPGTGPRPDEAVVGAARLIRDERAWGEALFAKEWAPNDPMSHGGDGLGPVYNETSCMACHGLGAPGGGGSEGKNVILLSATPNGRIAARGLDQVHPGFRGTRSIVLHRYGVDPEYASWRRRFYESHREGAKEVAPNRDEDPIAARIRALKEQAARERRMSGRSPVLRALKDYTLALSERNPPALFGAGRIDAIPSEVLVALAGGQRAEVRGRVSRTRDGGIGRFGWKAQIGSLHEFVRAACANELGLEVPGHAQAISPLEPEGRARELDLTESDCDAMVSYVRSLPTPVVVDPSGPLGTSGMREGRRLFAEVGCASCHTPTLGEVRGIYSDLLLHEMGQALNDSGTYYGTEVPDSPGGPGSGEWRTPPLWGYRDSGPYLHDGRAENLEEAVAFHEGQARASAHQFFTLSPRERSQVESFLKSLVAPSAAPAPGVILAADLESRIEQEDRLAPETLVRRRREEAVAREQAQWHEAQHRRRAEVAARRAQVRFPAARDLEKMGKIAGALDYYREIAHQAPDTEEGRLAAERIAALNTRPGSP